MTSSEELRHSSITEEEPKPVQVCELNLDPQNPRFAEKTYTIDDQEQMLADLWRERAVDEIVDSIINTGGYWRHEVLFVTNEDDAKVVVEGNRRLAAVKVLVQPELAENANIRGVPEIDDKELIASLETLPVIFAPRKEVWALLGFKHVNGPQDWDSISKAEYVAKVHNEYGVPLEDIAKTIGDRHDTVRRMYRGLMVLKQAENEELFDRHDCYSNTFSYSHLWTALGYQNTQEFLNIGDTGGYEPNPVPNDKLEELRELLLWIYGSEDKDVKPKIERQNPDLRNLIKALRDPDGLQKLRADLPLQEAYEASIGEATMLARALDQARSKLSQAQGYIPEGVNEDYDFEDKATTILNKAKSICNDILYIYQEETP